MNALYTYTCIYSHVEIQRPVVARITNTAFVNCLRIRRFKDFLILIWIIEQSTKQNSFGLECHDNFLYWYVLHSFEPGPHLLNKMYLKCWDCWAIEPIVIKFLNFSGHTSLHDWSIISNCFKWVKNYARRGQTFCYY